MIFSSNTLVSNVVLGLVAQSIWSIPHGPTEQLPGDAANYRLRFIEPTNEQSAVSSLKSWDDTTVRGIHPII